MATKDKAKKKSKLRHAEYYDFQGIQDKLYADSQKGRVFKHLVEIITLPENIRLAYRNIKANHGSKTAGTDGRTIKDLENLPDEKLVALVQKKLGWYKPQSVLRVEIPKGSDPTKKRPLGIPTILDRLIQRTEIEMTAGTKKPETVSAILAMGALVAAASLTIRMIWASVVSSPTRVASHFRKPDWLVVAALTLSPAAL